MKECAAHQLTTVGESGGRYNATFAYGVAGPGGVTSGSGKLRSAKVCSAPTCTAMSGGQVVPRDVQYQYVTGSTVIDPEAPAGLANTAGGAQLTSYTYETSGTGNLKTSSRPGLNQTDTFDYDGEDQLRRSVRSSAGGTAGKEEYYYDHNGQRVGVVTRDSLGAITGTRLFVGDTEIELATNGTVSQAYAYRSLGTPVAKVVSPAGGWTSSSASWSNDTSVLELQYHGLSSNTLLSIGPTATVKSGFVYAPYGDLVQTTGASVAAQHRRFNDKFQDDLTKLSYYGVRYYDGLSLTWTQADPLYRFAPDAAWSEPRRAHLYQYVLGNPTKYVDPDGRDARCPACLVPEAPAIAEGAVILAHGIGAAAFVLVAIAIGGEAGEYEGEVYETTDGAGTWSFPRPVTLEPPTDMTAPKVEPRVVPKADAPPAPDEPPGCGTDSGGATGRTVQVPTVADEKLAQHVKNFYKGSNKPDSIGDGTTADAIRYERATGQRVGGKLHSQKGRDMINGVEKRLRSGKLSDDDRCVANFMVKSLKDALDIK